MTIGEITHGYARRGKVHYLYRAWNNITQSCGNPRTPGWQYYGARGIKVDPRWEESSACFVTELLDAIGERPSVNHSLDRIDNDGHWQPGNIRWATGKEQLSNSRRATPEVVARHAATLKGRPRSADLVDRIRASWTPARRAALAARNRSRAIARRSATHASI
jgi:hypothetical protein